MLSFIHTAQYNFENLAQRNQVDFLKSFDRVDHKLFVDTLEHFG
jgi:hypothetical protein